MLDKDIEMLQISGIENTFKDSKPIRMEYMAENGCSEEELEASLALLTPEELETMTVRVTDFRKYGGKNKRREDKIQKLTNEQTATIIAMNEYLSNNEFLTPLYNSNKIGPDLTKRVIELIGGVMAIMDSGFRNILRSVPGYERQFYNVRLSGRLMSACEHMYRATMLSSSNAKTELIKADEELSFASMNLIFMYNLRYISFSDFKFYNDKLLNYKNALGLVLRELNSSNYNTI